MVSASLLFRSSACLPSSFWCRLTDFVVGRGVFCRRRRPAAPSPVLSPMPGRLLGQDVGFSGWWPLGGCWFELPGDRRFVGLWLGSVEAGACLSPRPGQTPPSCLLPPAPHSVEVLHHWLGAFSDAGNSAGPITDLVGDWWVGRDPAHVFSTGWGRSPLWRRVPPLPRCPGLFFTAGCRFCPRPRLFFS